MAQNLNHYTCLLQVKRDRGIGRGVEVETSSMPGIHIIDPQLKVKGTGPAYEFGMKSPTRFNLRVAAENKGQMASIVNRIIQEHPEIDSKSRRKLRRKAKRSKIKITRPVFKTVNIKYSGREELRVVCKNAVSFYLFKGGERSDIKHLLEFIFEGGPNRVVLFANPDEVEIRNLEPDRAFHAVVLRGNKDTKILTAYVEYYEIYKFHVLLSENYQGEDFVDKYIYDIYSRQEVEKKIKFNSSPSEIKTGFKYMNHGNLSPVIWEKLWWLMKTRNDEKKNAP